MTDKTKLPEVGKRYKNKFSYKTYLLRCIEIDNFDRPENYKLRVWFKDNSYAVCIEEFWDHYEELPPAISKTETTALEKVKIIAINYGDREPLKFLIEDEKGLRSYATLSWFQENFLIYKKPEDSANLSPSLPKVGFFSSKQEGSFLDQKRRCEEDKSEWENFTPRDNFELPQEVREAMEGLREKITAFCKRPSCDEPIYYLSDIRLSAKALLNSLDNLSKKSMNDSTKKDSVDKALEELKRDLNDFEESPIFATHGAIAQCLKRHREKAQNLVNALEEERKSLANSIRQENPVSGISEPTKEKVYYSEWQKSECGRIKARTGTTSTLKIGEEDKPKLPWKDVSELPDFHGNICCLVKFKDGVINLARYFSADDIEGNARGEFVPVDLRGKFPKQNIKEFCLISDFITDYESEKQAREQLEDRTKNMGDCLSLLYERVERLEKKKEVDLEKFREAKDKILGDRNTSTTCAEVIELIIEVLKEGI